MLWVLLAFVGIIGGVAFARYRGSRQSVLSLIVLFREPTFLAPDRILAAGQAAGMTVEFQDDPMTFLLDGYAFKILMAPVPYGEGYWTKDQLTEGLHEARLREAIREHKAFASFWFQDAHRDEWPQALAKVGKLIAELVDEQALVVWRADTNQAIRLTDETRDRLRRGETVEALGELVGDEISEIPEDDPRMVRAVEEARRRWPEFVEAVGRINDPEATWLKAPFGDGFKTEHMWVSVESADSNTARGKLMNKPFQVRGFKKGQPVEVKAEEITDWMYGEGEEMIGLFTEKIVRGIE